MFDNAIQSERTTSNDGWLYRVRLALGGRVKKKETKERVFWVLRRSYTVFLGVRFVGRAGYGRMGMIYT